MTAQIEIPSFLHDPETESLLREAMETDSARPLQSDQVRIEKLTFTKSAMEVFMRVSDPNLPVQVMVCPMRGISNHDQAWVRSQLLGRVLTVEGFDFLLETNEAQTHSTLVSPFQALFLLSRMLMKEDGDAREQRSVTMGQVRLMYSLMKAGKFVRSDSRVQVLKEGKVFNAQHRLFAILLFGVSQPLDVSTGWDVESISATDHNVKLRSNADILRMEGDYQLKPSMGAAQTVEAALRLIKSAGSNNERAPKLEAHEVNPLLELYGPSFEAIMACVAAGPKKDYRAPFRYAPVIAAFVAVHRAYPEKIEEICREVLNRTNGGPGEVFHDYLCTVNDNGGLRKDRKFFEITVKDKNDRLEKVRIRDDKKKLAHIFYRLCYGLVKAAKGRSFTLSDRGNEPLIEIYGSQNGIVRPVVR